MLRIFFGLLCVTIVAASCLKSNNDTGCPYEQKSLTVPAAELDSVRAYLDSNNLEAVAHPSGLFYNIATPGTGTDSVELCSQILISYKGQLKNGTVFDQNSNAVLVLGSLIEGWKKGIPLLKKGGRIKLYIPPTLGYGGENITNNNGQVVIPANSILIFDVTLIDYSVSN